MVCAKGAGSRPVARLGIEGGRDIFHAGPDMFVTLYVCDTLGEDGRCTQTDSLTVNVCQNTHSGSVYSYKFINTNAKLFFLYK